MVAGTSAPPLSRSVKLVAVTVAGSSERVKVARTNALGLTPDAESSGDVVDTSGGGAAWVANCHVYAFPSGAPSADLIDEARVTP